MIIYYKPLLVRLFAEAQRIHANPFEYPNEILELQETLIKKITYVELQIKKLKTSIKELRKTLGTKQTGLNKVDSQKIKDKIAQYSAQIDGYQDLLVFFRWIGDAIVFSFIDRWDIKPLAIKEGAGFLSGKKGARRERGILRGIFKSGYIAILTDLTNCLRYGDIAVFHENRPFQIFEVKSSKNISKRVIRQEENTKRILEYILTDKTNFLYGREGDFKRIPLFENPIYYIDEINDVVNEAIEKINCYKEVEDGLYYMAITKFDPEIFRQIEQGCKGEMIASLVNIKTYTDLAYFPLSLSIHNAEALYKVCTGELVITVILDMGLFKERLEANGVRLIMLKEDKDYAFRFELIQSEVNLLDYLQIGNHFFDRVFSEFLSANWLVKYIISMLQTNPTNLGLE
jgi:hypothetical protein